MERISSGCCTPGASRNLTEKPIRTAPPFDGHSLSRAQGFFFNVRGVSIEGFAGLATGSLLLLFYES